MVDSIAHSAPPAEAADSLDAVLGREILLSERLRMTIVAALIGSVVAFYSPAAVFLPTVVQAALPRVNVALLIPPWAAARPAAPSGVGGPTRARALHIGVQTGRCGHGGPTDA